MSNTTPANQVGPLETGEVKALRFDFSTEVTGIATIDSVEVVCITWKGVDAAPNLVMVGLPTVEGLQAVQVIKPGVVGCTYLLTATATDTAMLKHKIAAYVTVTDGR